MKAWKSMFQREVGKSMRVSPFIQLMMFGRIAEESKLSKKKPK
jgi:hypothetical protein